MVRENVSCEDFDDYGAWRGGGDRERGQREGRGGGVEQEGFVGLYGISVSLFRGGISPTENRRSQCGVLGMIL